MITNYLKEFVRNMRLERIRRMNKYNWSIGIYEGTAIDTIKPVAGIKNPVLRYTDVTDVNALFVADPFVVKKNDLWYMFFEVLNLQKSKGQIGLAISTDGYSWEYQKIILDEPFHLSYPQIVEIESEWYMIPETQQTKTVRLYKAVNFPYEWTFTDTLLSGRRFCDATVFRHDNSWWMIAETNPSRRYDQLRLYYSDELRGPWFEHPLSPVIDGNPHIARPCGKVVTMDNKLIRFAQDCYPHYGLSVSAFHITELSRKTYRETRLTDGVIFKGSGSGWNASGMHHIDIVMSSDNSLIAFTDGW